MNIVVAVRCLNELHNIPRFMRGYDFADTIVVSDGGSTDGSVELLHTYPKVRLFHFTGGETVNGYFWNTDAPHMNFVLDAAKSFNPDWLLFDDLDDVPNYILRGSARVILEGCHYYQVNAFRLYMWGDDSYFPKMSGDFNPDYTSIWAWRPDKVKIHADKNERHGTLRGLSDSVMKIIPPSCLLHKSWHPDTIEKKMDRYNAIGLPMFNPLEFAGNLEKLPEWAHE